MAGRQIDFNINASDNGTLDKLTSKAKTANQEFEKLKNTASSVGTGTKSGDQAMRRATAAPVASTELDDYTTAGGVGRRRGAGARDFAAEAQGLGGLVRLYAEYAANIYAVTAAFGALQNAMQTEIMIRGMQQLGAATGNSLVGMTKEFVQATDGMVSFREAAEAVTKVTTSGMGKQQVMDIATVAKGASQALGLSMTDAVSRLSRGITKLEPELLDELGLFTKLDKAVTDYARSVGKSEGQLTDFERRQAFANAVLEEGKKKFSEIAQAGNPYDQLLANLKNVATDILSVVNTVIGPIAKILADNTGLLTAAIGLFALKIVSKVFPVLGDYRDKLDRLAKESKDKAAQLAAVAEAREGAGRFSPNERAGLPQAQEALKLAQEREAVALKELNTISGQKSTMDQRLAAEVKLNALIKERQKAEMAVAAADAKAERLGQSLQTASPTAWIQRQEAKGEAKKAAQTSIVADVSRGFEQKGIRESFYDLGAAVKAGSKELGVFGQVSTYVFGALAILGQTIVKVGGFFLKYLLGPIGWIITGYQALEMLFSTNEKALQKFGNSLDQLEDITKTATDTHEKFKNSLGIEPVIAYANSIKNLDEGIQNLVKNFADTKKSDSWFDRFTNFLADITPVWDSLEEKTSKGVGAALAAGLNNIKSAPLKAEVTKKYREILKIDEKTPLTPKTMEEGLNKLDGFGAEAAKKYQKALEDLGVVSADANKKIQDQSLYLRGLVESGDLATKSIQSFMNSLKDSSPLSQMLSNNIKYLSQLGKALAVDDFSSQVAALDALSKVDFTMFGDAAIDISKMSDALQKQRPEIDKVNAGLLDQQAKLDQLKAGRKNAWYQFGPETTAGRQERMGQISNLEKEMSANKKIIDDFEQQFSEMRNRVAAATSAAVKQNAAEAVKAHMLELEKIKIDYQKSLVGMLPVKTESSLKLQADLDKKSIDIESRLVKSQMDLANSTDKLRIAIELSRDRDRMKELSAKGLGADEYGMGGSEEYRRLQKRQDSSQALYNAIDKGTYKDIERFLVDFPEAFDAMQRRMKQAQVDAKAASDKSKVDVKLSVDTIKLKAEEARTEIAYELEKTSQIISQIGSDTPEKLQAQIDFANSALDRQLATIKSKAQEQIDIIDKLQKAGGIDKEVAADERVKVNLEAARATNLAKLKTDQENFNRSSQRNVMLVKETNDLMIKRLEIQKQLIRGESLEAFDQINFKNEQILQLQQQIELVEAQEAARRSRQTASSFALAKGGTGLDGPIAMSAEDKGQLASLQAAAAADERRVNTLMKTHDLTREQAKEAAAYERTTRQVAITEAQLRAESAARLRTEEQASATRDHQLRLEETRLSIQGQLGTLVGDDLKNAQMNLEFRKIDNQLLIDQKRLVEEIAAAERALAEQKRQAGTSKVIDYASGTEYTVENVTPGVIQQTEALDAAKQRLTDVGTNAKRAKDAIKAAFVPDPIQRFSQTWMAQTDKMTDAFMTFVETGKFSFKDLMKSILTDFLKMLVKMQMEAMAAQALRTALAFLGFSTGGVVGGTSTGGSSFNAYVDAGGFAKGGTFGPAMDAYAMGGTFAKGGTFSLEGYAKGGSFTNKVVDSPTVFKFAQGGAPNRLGVMGEAGPEAIMPLKRMSSGNLGVESGGGGTIVDIKVNNYSGKEASTTQTTDSRGNRRIEITVGDMVSGEISRTNSGVQNSIGNTFGMKPQLIKR